MKITETVRQFAEPVVQAHGCSLWDVEYVREGADWKRTRFPTATALRFARQDSSAF